MSHEFKTARTATPNAWARFARLQRGAAQLLISLLVILGWRCVRLAGLADDASIQSNLANLYIGEEKVIEGTVTAAQRDGNTVHLRLGKPPQDLTVSLIVTLMSNFPATPERYYLGQTVRVGGTLHSFRGTPEIVIRDPADIQVLGAPAPPARGPTANDHPASATGVAIEASSIGERVDTLADRLHRLEERVQQLERSGSSRESR